MPDRTATAGLAALIVLQVVMLLSLYTQTPPHPPTAVAPFAIAPFLAAALGLAVAALIVGPTANRLGRTLALLAVAAALVSYGPQKVIDAQFAAIWPAVIGGQVAAIGVVWAVWATRGRTGRA
ncbi:MAG: hypothetical protein AAGE03_15205 [Pseudomonadota bacterium]